MTAGDGGRIHGWWNRFHRLIQHTGMAYTHGFSTMERSSEKNSDLRSQLKCEGARGGVKGRDERQKTAPLTPPLTPGGLCALTTANVVIHRMTEFCLDSCCPTLIDSRKTRIGEGWGTRGRAGLNEER